MIPHAADAAIRRVRDQARLKKSTLVAGIAVGTEYGQMDPAEVRTKASAPDDRANGIKHAAVPEHGVATGDGGRAFNGRQTGHHMLAARRPDQRSPENRRPSIRR